METAKALNVAKELSEYSESTNTPIVREDPMGFDSKPIGGFHYDQDEIDRTGFDSPPMGGFSDW